MKTITAIAAALLLSACEITQEHIDEASKLLSEATVAVGQPPKADGGQPLRRGDLADSTWRFIDAREWPHAFAVATLGDNGRIVWHVVPNRLADTTRWEVRGGAFRVVGRDAHEGVTVDKNNACLRMGSSSCGMVLQRVTP